MSKKEPFEIGYELVIVRRRLHAGHGMYILNAVSNVHVLTHRVQNE